MTEKQSNYFPMMINQYIFKAISHHHHPRRRRRNLPSLVTSITLHALHLIQSFLLFITHLLYPHLVDVDNPKNNINQSNTTTTSPTTPAAAGGGPKTTAVSRALTQLLSTLNDVPVSSRKYEMVRSLAEKVVEDNGSEGLTEVNYQALAAAFGGTLTRLEAASEGGGSGKGILFGSRLYRLGLGLGLGMGRGGFGGGGLKGLGKVGGAWLWDTAVRLVRGGGGGGGGGGGRRSIDQLRDYGHQVVENSNYDDGGVVYDDTEIVAAEKLAAELFWVVEKWVDCGGAKAAVEKWGSAVRLARNSLTARPTLQGALVKVSAFLIKQAKDLKSTTDERYSGDKGEQTNHQQQQNPNILDETKAQILLTWLPLLCRGINGTDAPILTAAERRDLERATEDIVESLERDEDKERVMSTWLHHFSRCASSDWPNLRDCYLRWCSDARRMYVDVSSRC